MLDEPAAALGNCADRNPSAASSRLTTTLRVCVSGPVALVSLGDDSSSNAVCRTAVSIREELDGVEGALNRNGFPDAAYPFVLSDVEVELVSTVDIDEVDVVDRAVASARSLRHFNSEAAFALDTQTAAANKAKKLNRQLPSGS